MQFETTIRNKIALNDFRMFLKEHLNAYRETLSLGTGYDQAFERAEMVTRDFSSNDEIRFEQLLNEFVRNRIVFDYKVKYSFKLSSNDINHIFNRVTRDEIFIQALKHDDKLNTMTEAQFRAIPFGANELITSYLYNDSLACLVFTSKHSTKTKVEIDPQYIRTAESYAQVYGIRDVFYQNFDVVTINKNTGFVDFCIDNSSKLSQKLHEDFYKMLRVKFLNLFNIPDDLFTHNFNYFPFIKKFYESETGTVKDLEFKTSTGSSKRGTMRADEDLRLESFHSAGKEVVDIEPFLLELSLSRIDHEITLRIPGREQILSAQNPKIIYCEINGVQNVADFFFLTDTVYTEVLHD